jgi:hypothetical protein
MMPQITVTLESDVLRGLERLEKGKKSKFVNAAVRYLMQNICWDRVDFMRLAMHHAWDALHEAKEFELAQIHPDQKTLGDEE